MAAEQSPTWPEAQAVTTHGEDILTLIMISVRSEYFQDTHSHTGSHKSEGHNLSPLSSLLLPFYSSSH